ncbi:autotransporter outer membrane beta-barrel domain-containing protein [Bartonella sp. SD1336NMGDW]|uniref:autotransporter outer membrane beta-barrel domain-containing protein n=1 Tax=Bartonella sp. SD1336NMGDW TaxID=3243575 RepID=UPI0035D096DB
MANIFKSYKFLYTLTTAAVSFFPIVVVSANSNASRVSCDSEAQFYTCSDGKKHVIKNKTYDFLNASKGKSVSAIYVGKQGTIVNASRITVTGSNPDEISQYGAFVQDSGKLVLTDSNFKNIPGLRALNGVIQMNDGKIEGTSHAIYASGKKTDIALVRVNVEIKPDNLNVKGIGIVSGLDAFVRMSGGTVTFNEIGAFSTKFGGKYLLDTMMVEGKGEKYTAIVDNESVDKLPEAFDISQGGAVHLRDSSILLTDMHGFLITNFLGYAYKNGKLIQSYDSSDEFKKTNINIERSNISVHGMGVHGLYFDTLDSDRWADMLNIDDKKRSETEKIVLGTASVYLSKTSLTVPDGIAIYATGTEGLGAEATLELSEGTRISGDLLFKAQYDSFITVKARDTTLTGDIRVEDTSTVDLELTRGSTWYLTQSKYYLIQSKNEDSQEGISIDTSVSYISLSDSTIVFNSISNNYQTLRIGKKTIIDDIDDISKQGELIALYGLVHKDAYSAQGNSRIKLGAFLNDDGLFDTQKVDRILIYGDVSGETTLLQVEGFSEKSKKEVRDKGSESVSLVQVSGYACEDSFQLASGYVTIGSFPYQYHLRAYGPNSSSGKADPKNRLVAGNGDFWDFRLEGIYVSSKVDSSETKTIEPVHTDLTSTPSTLPFVEVSLPSSPPVDSTSVPLLSTDTVETSHIESIPTPSDSVTPPPLAPMPEPPMPSAPPTVSSDELSFSTELSSTEGISTPVPTVYSTPPSSESPVPSASVDLKSIPSPSTSVETLPKQSMPASPSDLARSFSVEPVLELSSPIENSFTDSIFTPSANTVETSHIESISAPSDSVTSPSLAPMPEPPMPSAPPTASSDESSFSTELSSTEGISTPVPTVYSTPPSSESPVPSAPVDFKPIPSPSVSVETLPKQSMPASPSDLVRSFPVETVLELSSPVTSSPFELSVPSTSVSSEPSASVLSKSVESSSKDSAPTPLSPAVIPASSPSTPSELGDPSSTGSVPTPLPTPTDPSSSAPSASVDPSASSSPVAVVTPTPTPFELSDPSDPIPTDPVPTPPVPVEPTPVVFVPVRLDIQSEPRIRAVVPQLPTYLLLPNALFHTRLMDLVSQNKKLKAIRSSSRGSLKSDENPAFFIRGYGGSYHYASNLSAFEYGYGAELDYSALEAGVLLKEIESSESCSLFGVMGTYGNLSLHPLNVEQSKKSPFDKWSVAAYGSLQHDAGFYMDGLLSYGLFRGDVFTLARGKVATLKGKQSSASLTSGKTFAIGRNGFVFDPQLQLIYQHLQFDGVRDVDSIDVDMGKFNQWTARAGGRLTKFLAPFEEGRVISFYGKLYLMRSFGDRQFVSFKNDFQLGDFGSSLEAGLGFNAKLSSKFVLHGDINYQHGLTKAGFSGMSFSGRLQYLF